MVSSLLGEKFLSWLGSEKKKERVVARSYREGEINKLGMSSLGASVCLGALPLFKLFHIILFVVPKKSSGYYSLDLDIYKIINSNVINVLDCKMKPL